MKVLFYSPDAYSVCFPETKYIFGGVETEVAMTAKALAEMDGFDVTVVTRDQGTGVQHAGKVKVVPNSNLKGAGYWEKRKTLGNRIAAKIFGSEQQPQDDLSLYDRINPDIIYVMGLNPRMKELVQFCRLRGRKLIFKAAHDMDFGGIANNDAATEKWAGRSMAELRAFYNAADLILVQNPFQQKILHERFGLESELILNPIEMEGEPVITEKKYDVLWVGKNNHFKRPELLVAVAKQLPDRKFCMICNKFDETTWDALVATIPLNAELIESVPAGEIQNYFARSRVFLSTSPHEGFANTFLQAAKSAVPIISMCSNPNEMLTTHNAGILCSEDVNECIKAVQQLLANEKLRAEKGEAGFRYVHEYHDLNGVVARLIRMFTNLQNTGTVS